MWWRARKTLSLSLKSSAQSRPLVALRCSPETRNTRPNTVKRTKTRRKARRPPTRASCSSWCPSVGNVSRWSHSQCGFALHFAGCSCGTFASELEEAGLLCDAIVTRWRQRLRLLALRPVALSAGPRVDDEEAGRQEAQEGAAGGHHGNDPHAAHRVHHRAQRRRHQDLRDVHLAWQDGAVDAKASLGVPGTVLDVLQTAKTHQSHLNVPWFCSLSCSCVCFTDRDQFKNSQTALKTKAI